MKTTLHTDWTVADICEGFVYNEFEGKGLFGMNGRLTIQPEYQRNYIYADGKRERIRNTPLLVYVCEGTETEIKEWFRTINIAGVPLNRQEIRNAECRTASCSAAPTTAPRGMRECLLRGWNKFDIIFVNHFSL